MREFVSQMTKKLNPTILLQFDVLDVVKTIWYNVVIRGVAKALFIPRRD
jgi:hypothetical protein